MTKPKRRYEPQEPIHWKCPDCMIECRCTGLAQSLPHRRCGTKQPPSADEGTRQAYESWRRAHAVPGGHE
jgi:hypothetical protein